MREKLKKLFAYYGPYKGLFYSDMFFAVLGAVVTKDIWNIAWKERNV